MEPRFIHSELLQVILNKKGDTYDGKISDVWSCGVMLFVTLVGQYPFERPEDKGDPQKMHKMIRRIVNVDYKLPSRVEVSDECKVCTMQLYCDDALVWCTATRISFYLSHVLERAILGMRYQKVKNWMLQKSVPAVSYLAMCSDFNSCAYASEQA